jgi:hypothetical protein
MHIREPGPPQPPSQPPPRTPASSPQTKITQHLDSCQSKLSETEEKVKVRMPGRVRACMHVHAP